MEPLDRREFLGHVAAGASALAATGIPGMTAGSGRLEAHRHPILSGLAEPAFRPLPLGSIRPRGWLARQLRIQADGLTGHLDEFWPDVAQSQWFGGDAEGWERAPYWLDGTIAIAWVLDDARLKEKVSAHVEDIVRRQRPDGLYGPVGPGPNGKPYDMWAVLLANKVLAQYHEATGDDRVFRAVEASLRSIGPSIERTPLFDWGRYRWFEGLIPIFYVYERTGEPWLLDLARTLRQQGRDYAELYSGEDITAPTPRRGRWTFDKHVVNAGMSPKAGALSWRIDQRPADRELPSRMLSVLDRYHGQATGMFTGDETLAGKNPVQGTELCAVVEFLYTLETLVSVLGDAQFGDRMERVAFNALPATFKPDMWAHQYNQQVNQVQCTINPDHMWTSCNEEANIYGLAPEYGCCTSNMHQGWPKFTAHLWMATPGGGVAAVAYAPSEAQFRAGDTPVRVTMDTDYPFRESLRITVTPEQRAAFPLSLRVPQWADGATVRVADESPARMTPGGFHHIDREWNGSTTLELRFPMRPKVTLRYHGAVSLERGPLVYSLSPQEEWTRVHVGEPQRELPHGDFEVRPASAWNYGLVLDPENPEAGVSFEERPIGDHPFSPDGAGMRAHVSGRKLPDWKLRHGWADEIGSAAYSSNEPSEELTLLPYGCTNIRVTEFPRLEG